MLDQQFLPLTVVTQPNRDQASLTRLFIWYLLMEDGENLIISHIVKSFMSWSLSWIDIHLVMADAVF